MAKTAGMAPSNPVNLIDDMLEISDVANAPRAKLINTARPTNSMTFNNHNDKKNNSEPTPSKG
jgi:hypothetical protein